MPQDRQKRKDPTETDRCQGLQRTGASNLEREVSPTSSKSQKDHLQAQDLSGPTSPRARAKMSSPTKSQDQKELDRYQRVIDQQRFDQNKVDAIHGWHGQRQGSSNR